VFDEQRRFGVGDVDSSGIPLHAVFAVEVECEGHGVHFVERAYVIVVVAGELNDIRAEVIEQVDVLRVAAENIAGVIRIREGAAFIKGDFVADVGQIRRAHEVADFRAREEHAFGGHHKSGIARHGCDAAHDQAGQLAVVAVWGGQERAQLFFRQRGVRDGCAQGDPLSQRGRFRLKVVVQRAFFTNGDHFPLRREQLKGQNRPGACLGLDPGSEELIRDLTEAIPGG